MSRPRTTAALAALLVGALLSAGPAAEAASGPAASEPVRRPASDRSEASPMAVPTTSDLAAPAAGAGPVRLMPLGDSITFGTGSPGRSGYRIALRADLQRAGLAVDFVGSQHSGLCCDHDNEGHGGWSIQRLAEHVDDWLTMYAPDLVLLQAGTNNVSRGYDPAVSAAALSTLIDEIRDRLPAAHIFVATLIGTNVAAERAGNHAFNALVPGVVAAKDARVHLVDQSGVRGADLYDRHHPNAYGYSKMAFTWYNAIRQQLPGAAAWPALADPSQAATATLCHWNEPARSRLCARYRRTSVDGGTRWVLI